MDTVTPRLYCPSCGKQVPADAQFCRECGHDVGAHRLTGSEPAVELPTAETDVAVQPAVSEPEQEHERSACPGCGAVLPATAQFCGSCGSTVAGSADALAGAPSLVPTLVSEPAPAGPPPAGDAPPGRRFNARIAAIVVVVVLLGGAAAALLLSGGSGGTASTSAGLTTSAATNAQLTVAPPSDSTPTLAPETTAASTTDAATTPTTPASADTTPGTTTDSDGTTPSGTSLATQVQSLDGLMRLSEQGRAAAIRGDVDAAIASRTSLLSQLRDLRTDVDDPDLKAGLTTFIAAIRESLRQNRTCGTSCSPAALARVGRLKEEAVAKLNPLLQQHTGHTYSADRV